MEKQKWQGVNGKDHGDILESTSHTWVEENLFIQPVAGGCASFTTKYVVLENNRNQRAEKMNKECEM